MGQKPGGFAGTRGRAVAIAFAASDDTNEDCVVLLHATFGYDLTP